MEVWIAGATGALGRRVVPLLLEAGHTVVGLARTPRKWPDAPSTMRFVACDITDAEQVARAFSGHAPHAVLHLATALPTGRPTPRDWQRNDAIRRDGTRHLTEAALAADAWYLHQSVHYVYAPQGGEWIREDAPYGRQASIVSAIDAEQITGQAFQRGLRGSVIRPSTFYSADSPQIRALAQGLKSGLPALVGNGSSYWSFVHPGDVATAIALLLAKRPAGGVYNISDDEPAPMKDCLTWLAGLLKAPPPKSVAPFLARMAMGADMVDLLTGSRRIANAKARQELGWEPRYRSFRDGLTAEAHLLA